MGQLFPPAANYLAKASLLGLAGVVVAGGVMPYAWVRSSYMTRVDLVREQPVPFSHKHHVEGVGLDCRYCHTSVEDSSFAGIPATSICMNCHSQIWLDSPMLSPVRESNQNNTPLVWTRVYDLPDYVYFDHSIHLAKGIGCTTCHGQVDQMPLMKKTQTLFMQWCLECHRQPEKFIRPRERVFDVDYQPPANQLELGKQLVQQYHVRDARAMTDCITCHR